MKGIVIATALLVGSVGISAQAQQNTAGSPPKPADARTRTVLPQTALEPAAAPLSSPAITGPLQAAHPITLNGGPLGKLYLDGVLSGMGMVQGSHVAGDSSSEAALSDGQIFLQKAEGWWQFYVQAGAYNILSLGAPFVATGKQVNDLYGPVPVAYLKLVPAKNASIEVGALPTLIGAEYTFDFENMNIERGLLWNQENAINRGVQVNQSIGKLALSFSWNDGYYSNRYSWLSGSATYTNGAQSFSFVGMGNLGHTAFQTIATPVQNNSVMYALEYAYTKGKWIIQPYYQYTDVPSDSSIGIIKGATTQAGAVLISRTLGHGFSLAGRGEYIASSGSAAENAQNLLYGPGSSAWSATITPTYQRQRFFVRGEASVVHATSITKGDAFGTAGTNSNQARGVIEIGFLF